MKRRNKLSIAVIGCRFNHPFGERVLSMWRYLAKEYNVQVHIITTDRWIDKKGDSKLKDSKNLRIHKLFTIGAKHGQFKHVMPALPFKLMELNPNLIYAQEEPIQMGVTWAAYWTAKHMKKPFIFFTWENKLQKWFFPIGAVEDQIIRGSDLMIAGTKEAKEVLLKKGADEKKIIVLPETGIDTERFKPKTRYLPSKSILYIGRLVREKGINTLLKARDYLNKKNKRYKYVFVGDGPLRKKISDLADKYPDVKLLDTVPYDSVSELYRNGDVFFYASLRTKKWEEQYGYAMLEALASGLPVISTQGISGPEAIVKEKETGFLIPENDHKYLAKRIQSLMEDPYKLEKMSKYARMDAIMRVGMKPIAHRTYKIIKDLHNKMRKKQ